MRYIGSLRSWAQLVSITLAVTALPALAGSGDHSPRLAALPLTFVPNEGQSDPAVRFQADTMGGTLFFTPSEVVLALPQTAPATRPQAGRDLELGPPRPGSVEAGVPVHYLRLRFLDAAAGPEIAGAERLPGIFSSFRGSDPARWRSGLATYGAIVYRSLYPGVDLRYEGADGRIKGTYRVEAGADPSSIRWTYRGARATSLDRAGNLLIAAPRSGTVVMEQAPTAWQDIAGRRSPIPVRYAIAADGSIGFALPKGYDRTQPLILDPTLTYSTYLGGGGEDVGYSVAVDSSGATYVAGYTLSVDFPTLGANDPGCGTDDLCDGFAFTDAFVAKLNPMLSGAASLVFSTYLGGSDNDFGVRIAVDGTGESYVTGIARGDFPTTANAFQQTSGGGGNSDAFLTKLSANGAQLLYSTYLGGGGGEGAWGIALDASNNACIVGQTTSSGFPITGGALDTSCGTDGVCNSESDAFVAKLNPAASGAASLLFSTFLGGSTSDQAFGVAVDATGNVYVTGRTTSADFPTAGGPYQSSSAGGQDAFVAKLNAAGTALTYSTYFGGNDYDDGYSLALGAGNRAYVVGTTFSSTLPTTAGALQPSFGGLDDAYLAKVDPAVSGAASLVHSTYLGGDDDDQGYGVAVDGSDVAYVTGFARSPNLPTAGGPFQPANGGFWDAFVMKVDPALSGSASLLYSTYVGGLSTDAGFGLAIDPSRNIYLTGQTFSSGSFPTVNPFQGTLGGNSDVFVARIDTATTAADLSVGQTDAPDPVPAGGDITYTVTVTNGGPAAATGVRLTDVILGSVSFVSATPTQGSCTTVSFFGEQDVSCDLGPLANGGTATVSIVVTPFAAGIVTSTARVSSNVSDLDAADNVAVETTTAPADLSITKTDGQASAVPGQPITYTIVVSNAGPFGVTVATVSDTVPVAITGAAWTCVATGGAFCSSNGSGDINETVDVPVGDTVTFTLTGAISPSATGSLSNTASVAAPDGVDPVPGNNSATDTDSLGGGCDPEIVLVPDGRAGSDTISGGGTRWFAASLRIGNSYSVEFANASGNATPPGTLTVFSGDDGCATSTLTTRDTTAVEPPGTLGAIRRSFTATGTATYFRAQLVNGSGGAIPLSFSWSDTTMFSPAWSHTGAFDTFYSFQNTTGAMISGTLTLRNGAGAVVATLDVSIPPGQAAGTNTLALGVTGSQTGTARFIHDGPPGAVLAEAAIARFSSNPAYVQPVKFQAVREATH